MAQIQEERIVIKLSKLVKTGAPVSDEPMIQADLVKSLEQVVQELAGDKVIVEVEAIE
jgi:GTP cyclohydrolase I